MTVLGAYLNEKISKCQTRNGKTKEEILEQNRERKRQAYAEARENGAPTYSIYLLRKRIEYWQGLKDTLSPTEFLTRLARLKIRSVEKYKQILKGLSL